VLVRPHHIIMRWLPSQRLIVAFIFCLETPKAGTGQVLKSSLPCELTPFLYKFQMPFTCVAVLFLLQYHLYVHLSSRFVSAVQLKMMIGNISVKISMGFPPCRHRRRLQVLHYAQTAVGSQQHVPAALSLGKGACAHCRGGWLGPRVGLHGMRLRKLLP